MNARMISAGALTLAVIVVGFIVLGGGSNSDTYTVGFKMNNALGLRDGSQVVIGGVKIGEVKVSLGKDDQVLVKAELDKGKGPVGKNVHAYVTSVNLLGQKRLELDKGNVAQPAADGATFGSDRVTASTDLDQVLAVLTPDVRSRLDMLIDEAGATVVGRDQDISQLISTLPPTIDKATKTLNAVVGDNHTISDLVTHSDTLIEQLAHQRKSISSLIDSAGKAASSAATKRQQLEATINDAPATLTSLQHFLGELKDTTVPLGPAARDIAQTAPQLQATMDQLAPFTKEASPTLAQATKVAPSLTKLATGATPVVRKAVPTLAALASLSTELQGVGGVLDKSVDNLVGTVDNWSRAVQYRDGISHIFRGEAAVTPQTLDSIISNALTDATRKKAKDKKSSSDKPAVKVPQVKLPEVKKPTVKVPAAVPGSNALNKVLDDVGNAVTGVVNGVTQGKQPPKDGGSSSSDSSTKGLLDYLLGK